MLDLSPVKILLVAVVALIVLGPEKLPGAVKTAGKYWGELRRIRANIESEVRSAVGDLPVPGLNGTWTNPVSTMLDGIAGMGSTLRSAVATPGAMTASSGAAGAVAGPLGPDGAVPGDGEPAVPGSSAANGGAPANLTASNGRPVPVDRQPLFADGAGGGAWSGEARAHWTSPGPLVPAAWEEEPGTDDPMFN